MLISEFQCEAYVDMDNDYRLLVTKQELDESEQYACWVSSHSVPYHAVTFL